LDFKVFAMASSFSASFKSALLVALCLAANAMAAEHPVSQKNLEFSIKKLSIKVGDSVIFSNQDSVVHNVYSLSNTQTFDLGAILKGKSKSVTFDKAGTVEVECAVHPQMKVTIEVKK
jgi:plastocyanin